MQRATPRLLEFDDEVVGRVPRRSLEQHVVAVEAERCGALAVPDRHVLDMERTDPATGLDAIVGGEFLDQRLELVAAIADRGQLVARAEKVPVSSR